MKHSSPKNTEKRNKVGKFLFEFFTIFVGIFAAFALDNWNENRKDTATGRSILMEIKNGLEQDKKDLDLNASGHQWGIVAVEYYKKVLLNKPVATDSAAFHYFNLFRSFIAVQNAAGFETLKSKGLDIIGNDSLRTEILTLYENDYNAVRKLEENYAETQFQMQYFREFNEILAPAFMIDTDGNFESLKLPLTLSQKNRNTLLVNLWKMKVNRQFLLHNYAAVQEKIGALERRIKKVVAE